MPVGVILLNFGEPEHPTMDEVVPFLERIFLTNASLEGALTPEQARTRSRELAERRAPSLIAEYEAIGGSPLNAQAAAQADALAAELERRGVAAMTYVGMQFTDPTIRAAAERARADGASPLIALPVYPLAGPSTSVAALASLEETLRQLAWNADVREVTGWHRHPGYVALRAEGIRETFTRNGIDPSSPWNKLVFSAHGTPVKYLEEGSRYDVYVHEHCRALAEAAGLADYVIGYQNHGNRPVEWTQPDIEDVIRELDADRVVVVPVSFMHEQSETLAELDGELRETAEARGLEFHRVPIPHDDPRFAALLADLVEAVATGDPTPAARAGVRFQRCVCRNAPNAVCAGPPTPARMA